MTPDLSGAASRAVQVATRAAVWVECRCGHEWQSRAKDRMTIRCPECGTGQRVPYRTHANTGPTPEGHLPPPRTPAPPRTIRPTRARTAPAWEPDDDPEDEPPRSSLADWMRSGGREELTRAFPPGGLAGILAGALGGQAPAAPAPARRAAARRPAPPARPARRAAPNPPALLPTVPTSPAGTDGRAIDPQTLPERELRRRDDVCQIVASLSASLRVWYNRPAGCCEALDTNQPSDRQRCPGTAAFAVRFQNGTTEADAFTCVEHARPLASIANRAQYINATIYRLK